MTTKPKPERISKADLARLAGKTRAAVGRQLSRHGVNTGRDGLVDKAAALDAMAVGAALDKNKAKSRLAELEATAASSDTDKPSVGAGSIVLKKEMAQLRRIILQGDLLEIERDKARGDLIPVDDYRAGLIEMQNVCLRLWDVWIESIGAKRKDAALVEELRRGRDQVLEETTAVLDERGVPNNQGEGQL